MHYTKKLVVSLIFLFSILSAGEVTFRGKGLAELAGTSIPLSFMNLITNNYEILPSQINPQRGSYMIISPDGIAAYLDDFVEFKTLKVLMFMYSHCQRLDLQQQKLN